MSLVASAVTLALILGSRFGVSTLAIVFVGRGSDFSCMGCGLCLVVACGLGDDEISRCV